LIDSRAMHVTRLLTGLLLVALLGACATLPPGAKPDSRDRFERFNRSVYTFNSKLDVYVARPVAKAYVKATPAPVRTGVSNFFSNLAYTRVILNDLLQGKGGQFFADTGRLLLNTTIGIGGLFDPASQLGLSSNDEDFGQTLGKWGVPPGPYLMLPVFGPSTLRDAPSLIVDMYSEPDTYLVSDWKARAGLTVGELVDKRASLLGTDETLDTSYDPYAFVRNAYLQRRQFQVTDGAAAAQDDIEIFEDEADAPDPASGKQSGEQRKIDVPAADDHADAPAVQSPPQ
jgi:phospholipid-binding lipoprotein MlaA